MIASWEMISFTLRSEIQILTWCLYDDILKFPLFQINSMIVQTYQTVNFRDN